MSLWLIISLLIKGVCFLLFCILTSYVILYGKKGSGIRMDYFFTAMFLGITAMVM